MLKHESLKVGEVYKEIGVSYYSLRCVEVSDKVVNVGWNTYAKTAKFKLEHYSSNMKEFDRVIERGFVEQLDNCGNWIFVSHAIKPNLYPTI